MTTKGKTKITEHLYIAPCGRVYRILPLARLENAIFDTNKQDLIEIGKVIRVKEHLLFETHTKYYDLDLINEIAELMRKESN